jgi:hypothetical protein
MSADGFLSGLTLHAVRLGYDLRLIASEAKWLNEKHH